MEHLNYEKTAEYGVLHLKLAQWPVLDEEGKKSLSEVFESNTFVKGEKAKRLPEYFSAFINVPFCLSVSSCTHEIHLALKSSGIGKGDEVLVPNITFRGTVSSIFNIG